MAKIKKFAKEYISKILHKIEKKRRGSSDGKNGESSTMATSTPDDEGADNLAGDISLQEAALDDIMDIDEDDDYDDVVQEDHVSPDEPSPEESVSEPRNPVPENGDSSLPGSLKLNTNGFHISHSDHDWAGTPQIVVGPEQ